MKNYRLAFVTVIALLFGLCQSPGKRALADESSEKDAVTASGKCSAITYNEIPVEEFNTSLIKPLTGETKGWRRTQRYNTKAGDPDIYLPGHNGVDAGGEFGGSVVGEEEIKNVLSGKVLISSYGSGWGESVVVVSRVNVFSEEMITTAYHHLDKRYVSHCDDVGPGDLIGMEGKTGDDEWLAHLHFTVRRWANLDHLLNWLRKDNGEYEIYGNDGYFGHDGVEFKGGYGPGISSIDNKSPYYMYGYLSPEQLLFDNYLDYPLDDDDPYPAYLWSVGFVSKMRKYGIEFGLWDGRYGAGENPSKREIVRWLKIAAGQSSIYPFIRTYSDVGYGDPDFAYIEAMARYPSNQPVLNPEKSCSEDTHAFCPDQKVNRAEAVKMVVNAFYYDEFAAFYKYYFWLTNAVNVAEQLAGLLGIPVSGLFGDVDLGSWYAPYIYFGVMKGIVQLNDNFLPSSYILREEVAKWAVNGYENQNVAGALHCGSNFCEKGEYCNPETERCEEQSACMPSETTQCEVGGGYEPCTDDPECIPGQVQTRQCGNSGTQTASCGFDCTWGPFGDCIEQGICTAGQTTVCGLCGTMNCQINSEWGPCIGQGVCTPGQVEERPCGINGAETRTCTSGCYWGPWGDCIGGCECSSGICCDGCHYYSSAHICDGYTIYKCEGSDPGQDALKAVVNTKCSGQSSTCSGEIEQGSWTVYDNCSTTQKCEMDGNVSGCVPLSTCQDEYLANNSSACYTSANTQYGYRVCLELQKVSGASFRFRICNNSGAFTYGVKYRLYDLNHLSRDLGGPYQEGGGNTCTSWHTINLSYIDKYGSSNGAGLQGEIITPPACSLTSCKYKTGMITVSKICQ